MCVFVVWDLSVSLEVFEAVVCPLSEHFVSFEKLFFDFSITALTGVTVSTVGEMKEGNASHSQ